MKIITKAKENSPLYNIYPDDEKKFLPTAKKKNSRCLTNYEGITFVGGINTHHFLCFELDELLSAAGTHTGNDTTK